MVPPDFAVSIRRARPKARQFLELGWGRSGPQRGLPLATIGPIGPVPGRERRAFPFSGPEKDATRGSNAAASAIRLANVYKLYMHALGRNARPPDGEIIAAVKARRGRPHKPRQVPRPCADAFDDIAAQVARVKSPERQEGSLASHHRARNRDRGPRPNLAAISTARAQWPA